MKRAGPPLVGAIGIEQIRDRFLPTFCRPRPTRKRWEILGGEHPAVCTIVARCYSPRFRGHRNGYRTPTPGKARTLPFFPRLRS